MSIIKGKEKFWTALLGGSSAVTVLVLAAVAKTGAFETPGPDEIKAAVAGLVATVFAAAGAFLATNTSEPGDPVSVTVPAPTPTVETQEKK